SIATHEEGHSLGLGHTTVPGATMEAAYGGGTSLATIEQDDIAGVCALYPGTNPTSGVASSTAATSGSGGGQTCDQCTQSESAGACAAQYNACNNSQQCLDFYNCALNCNGNQACVQGCANMYASGAQQYANFRNCVCGVCVMECATE